MNEFLQKLYGGAPQVDADVMAQAELLSKVAEENGVDLSTLSDAELGKLAEELGLSGDTAEEQEEKQEKEEEEEKESMVWADRIGRVAAHAMIDELQKTAGPAATAYGAAKKFMQGAGGDIHGVVKGLGKKLTPSGLTGKVRKGVIENPATWSRATSGDVDASIAKRLGKVHAALGYGALGAGAAGVAGAHRALSKKSSIDSSIIEALAFDRATNFLALHGLAQAVPEAKIATPIVEDLVANRAAEMLVAAGHSELLARADVALQNQ